MDDGWTLIELWWTEERWSSNKRQIKGRRWYGSYRDRYKNWAKINWKSKEKQLCRLKNWWWTNFKGTNGKWTDY